jgi:hypothetical protein
MNLTTTEWTVVARSATTSHNERVWDYEAGVKPGSLYRDAEDEIVLMMQRRVPGGFDLVARIAPPAWRAVKRWRDANPVKRA